MGKVKQFSKNYLPLTPAIFYILLALATKDRHGYDIMKQVKEDSQERITLGPGTLYGAIKRMLEEKLIVELTDKADERRRYYRLTNKGRIIMNTEIERYNNAVTLAKKRKIFTAPAVAKLAFLYA